LYWEIYENANSNNSEKGKRPKIQEPGDVLTALVYPVKKRERYINKPVKKAQTIIRI
jgi:hypothetical protein